MSGTTSDTKPRGLDGVVAAQTRMSHVDGQNGVLIIGGYELKELAGKVTFEEASYLLWKGRLPSAEEKEELTRAIALQRALPESTLEMVRDAAKKGAPPIDTLRMACATLSLDLKNPSDIHGSASVQMNTGKPIIGRPSLGSWVSYGLGSENQDLPGYVVMLDKRGGPIGGQPNWSNGFIPASYQGTLFRPQGNPILDLTAPGSLTRLQQREQLDLLAEFNAEHLSQRPGGAELVSRTASYELAYRMQSETPDAVDLSGETASTLTAYGVNQSSTTEFGRNCLIARRLVERGVRFIQLYSGGGHLEETWDAHESVEKNHGQHAAETDQPIAALLADLAQRGLLDSTLIVWGGEFGRMPFSEGVDKPGRNHNPYGFSMWMAGGGVKGGVTYGETDELGFAAETNKVHVHDLHATILHLMGMDHTRLTYFHQGRDERLTDVYGNVVTDILA